MVVEVTALPVPFFTDPEDKVPVTPDSFASGQPSPSESRSKLFGIPSLSASQFVEIEIPAKPISSTSPVEVEAINSN